MEKESVIAKFRFRRIVPLSYTYSHPSQFGIRRLNADEFRFQVNHNYAVQKEEKHLTAFIFLRYIYEDNEGNEEAVVELTTASDFIIDNFEEAISINEDDSFDCEDSILATFLGLAYSSTRGILATYLGATPYNFLVLPVINPLELIKNEAPDKLSVNVVSSKK